MRAHAYASRTFALVAALCLTTQATAKGQVLKVGCVDSSSEVASAPSEVMQAWLGKFAREYNIDDRFTISATGAMNRVFDPSGRLIHPAELAQVIGSSSAFKGKKAERVELGISGTSDNSGNSYANRVSALLGTSVEGCDGIAYYLSNGVYICGAPPKTVPEVATRHLPIGFQPLGLQMFMVFCATANSTPDPRTMLSSQAAYGLFRDEIVELENEGSAQAAFRLYQYHWIARQDRERAMEWLDRAASLGSNMAKYNLAYENFEAGGTDRAAQARSLLGELPGGKFPDLASYYSSDEKLND